MNQKTITRQKSSIMSVDLTKDQWRIIEKRDLTNEEAAKYLSDIEILPRMAKYKYNLVVLQHPRRKNEIYRVELKNK